MKKIFFVIPVIVLFVSVFAFVKYSKEDSEFESMELSDSGTHDWDDADFDDEEDVDLSEFGILEEGGMVDDEQLVAEEAQRQPSNQSNAPVFKFFKQGKYGLADGDTNLCDPGNGQFFIADGILTLGNKHGIDIFKQALSVGDDPAGSECKYFSETNAINGEQSSKFIFTDARICGGDVKVLDVKKLPTLEKIKESIKGNSAFEIQSDIKVEVTLSSDDSNYTVTLINEETLLNEKKEPEKNTYRCVWQQKKDKSSQKAKSK